MESDPRQPAKLQKRKSRERQDLAMSGGLSGQPANISQPMAPSTNAASAEDKKKSKFRLSNVFHSKEKDKDTTKRDNAIATEPKEHNPKRDTMDTSFDSAYGSSEPSSSHPSFTNNNRPISGEQWHPPPASSHAPTTPPPQQSKLAPPPVHSLQNRSSHENISRETHRDASTGNIVTTTTTVCQLCISCMQRLLTLMPNRQRLQRLPLQVPVARPP
jgi:hypothetical protein